MICLVEGVHGLVGAGKIRVDGREFLARWVIKLAIGGYLVGLEEQRHSAVAHAEQQMGGGGNGDVADDDAR